MNLLKKRTFAKLHIKKRSITEWLILFLFILPFAFSFLTDILRLPEFIKFSLDAILVVLCFFLVRTGRVTLHRRLKPILLLVFTFFVYTLITYLVSYQSVFYYVWGLRNNFRFYIAFIMFVSYVSEEDAFDWLRLLDVLFWINFAVSLFQFFFLGVRQDYLGGIFGSSGGTNGYTLVFFCIVITKSLLNFFNGYEKTTVCLFKCLAGLVVAAMAEMKFYYIVFILIIVLTSLITSFSWKKFGLIFICIAGVLVSSALLTFLFGFEGFLSMDNLWQFAVKEHYSSQRDLNRFSAIFTLSEDFLTDFGKKFIGLGLGNCDLSEVSLFDSVFHQNYGYLHYTWFAAPMMFLETGLIGLVLYLSFFLLCFFFAFKRFKSKVGNDLFNQMTIVISILCGLIAFYNSSLRIESGYMVYFVLALPFIETKSKNTLFSEG